MAVGVACSRRSRSPGQLKHAGERNASGESHTQNDLRVGGMALCEAEDVTGVGVTPAVDQLVIIADNAQVPVRSGEQVDQGRLRVTGVLELVRQQPPPPS